MAPLQEAFVYLMVAESDVPAWDVLKAPRELLDFVYLMDLDVPVWDVPMALWELLAFVYLMVADGDVQCVLIGPIAKEPRKNLKVIVEDVTTDFIQNKR